MELKNYQKRVLRELDAYMSLLNSTQSLNAAYNKQKLLFNTVKNTRRRNLFCGCEKISLLF